MPARQPILCAGAALWDVIGRAAAPLAPGADVPGRVERRPGGVALNIALALAALGHPVALLAAIGRDPGGEALAGYLSAGGVDIAGIYRHSGATDSYVAVEDGVGELHAAVADCAGLEAAGEALLAPLADGRLAAPGWAVADGNLPAPVLARLLNHPATAAARFAIVPASAAKAAALATLAATRPVALYLNRAEAGALCGAAFPDSRAAARALRARGVAEAIVTDGAAPVTVAGAGGVLTLPAPPLAARSVTGAGDAFVAAHLAARADGLAPEPALRAALAASARHIACEVP
jgi:sugar/nucleoside kinase (ribokinase family)